MELSANEYDAGRYVVAKKAAEKLDAMSGGRYPAPYLALDSVMHAFSCEEDDALRHEAMLFGRLAATPESKSLMALFYMMENSKKTQQKLKARPLPVQKVGKTICLHTELCNFLNFGWISSRSV